MSCQNNSNKAGLSGVAAGVSSLASKGAYVAQSAKAFSPKANAQQIAAAAKSGAGNVARSAREFMGNNKAAVAGAMVGGAVAGTPGAAIGAATGAANSFTLGKTAAGLKRRGLTPAALRSAATGKVQAARAEYRQKVNAATAPYVAGVRATEAAARDWVKKNGDQVAGAVDQARANVKARSDQAGATIKQGAATVGATPLGRAAGATAGYARGVGRSYARLVDAERKMLQSNRAEMKNVKAARKVYRGRKRAFEQREFRQNPVRVLGRIGGATAVGMGVNRMGMIRARDGVITDIAHGNYGRAFAKGAAPFAAGLMTQSGLVKAMNNRAWRRSREGKAALATLKTAKSEAESRYRAAHKTYVQSLKVVGRSLLGRAQ